MGPIAAPANPASPLHGDPRDTIARMDLDRATADQFDCRAAELPQPIGDFRELIAVGIAQDQQEFLASLSHRAIGLVMELRRIATL